MLHTSINSYNKSVHNLFNYNAVKYWMCQIKLYIFIAVQRILHIHMDISKATLQKRSFNALVLSFLNVPFTPRNVIFYTKDTTHHYNHYSPLSSFSGLYMEKSKIIVWKKMLDIRQLFWYIQRKSSTFFVCNFTSAIQ